MDNIKETSATVSSQTTEQPRTYTQEELDHKIGAVRAKVEKRVDNNYVSTEQYNELLNKVNDFRRESKQDIIKQNFIKNGGREDAYNDFINSNGDLLDKEVNDKTFYDLKTNKPYFFKDNRTNQTEALGELNNGFDEKLEWMGDDKTIILSPNSKKWKRYNK